MPKTESETYFEEFCRRNDFDLRSVQVATTPTPDYTLVFGKKLVVVEVKEIEPPEPDVIGITPGKAVRKKIADSSKQIKARTQGIHPGLLVLWESGVCAGRQSEPYHILVAMSGFEQVLIDVPPLASGLRPSLAGMKHGPGRKMTPDANTSISAVALLCVPAKNELLLQVFHNRHAAIALDRTLLVSANVTHYVSQDNLKGTTEWVEV